LVGQFLDKPLPFFLVKKAVDSMWKQYGSVDVFLMENGMYIFRFSDEMTRDEVLEAKLWNISNKPLILRRWEPGMQLLKLSLDSLPIWIKLKHLPMEFWSPTCLGYVASGVGKPLYADSVTEDQVRLGFARVLVEVNTTSIFPKELFLKGIGGRMITVGVEYPWIPMQCSHCHAFGHAVHAFLRWRRKFGSLRSLRAVPVKIVANQQHIPRTVGQESGKSTAIRPPQVPREVFDKSPVPPVQNFQKPSSKQGSNSFAALRSISHSGLEEGEIVPHRDQIHQIQRLIEDALYDKHGSLPSVLDW
jgi:hypothetical protein